MGRQGESKMLGGGGNGVGVLPVMPRIPDSVARADVRWCDERKKHTAGTIGSAVVALQCLNTGTGWVSESSTHPMTSGFHVYQAKTLVCSPTRSECRLLV